MDNHRVETVAPLFKSLYGDIEETAPYTVTRPGQDFSRLKKSGPAGGLARMLGRFLPGRGGLLTVGMMHEFVPPPFGGGNQFMLVLKKAMLRRGVRIVDNRMRPRADAYIVNAVRFDVKAFRERLRKSRAKVVHRIDGPISLIRGTDRQLDDLCLEMNAEFATATVLQSAWNYRRIVEMGYRPVNPVIIHNAVDPDIFHPRGRIAFGHGRKIRLISTSWSGNPRKGGPVYKWIEEHLDWDRFEYTFVGNASEPFGRIRHIPPVPSVQLAGILRQHDIYITASRNDPCSNALIEALACGLPALYLNDGGHPELAGYGGLPFGKPDEIPGQLDAIADNYAMFQALISVPKIDEVAEKYMALVTEDA